MPLSGKPPGGKAGSALSETTERPAGDDRSADDIKDDHPVLDSLSSEDANRLKFWFGDFDFEKDADAAYRAAAAIENVKRYDSDGASIYDEDVNSDKIEKSEEDRFDRLLDKGPSALEGDGSWDDFHVTEKTELTDDIEMSAKDILEGNTTWNALAVPQRRALLELEPDLYTDPNAAYRSTQALNHIQVWDQDGNAQSADKDGKLDGFKSKIRGKDEKHDPTNALNDDGIDWAVSSHSDTKARQFETLIRDGYDSLKGTPAPNLNGDIAEGRRQEGLDDALKDAVKDGNAGDVSELIEDGANPGTEIMDGVDILFYAAGTGNVDTLEAIRESVSDTEWHDLIDKQGVNGETPVMAAMVNLSAENIGENGSFLDAANYLIDKGADTTIENNIGLSVEDLIDRSSTGGEEGNKLDKRGHGSSKTGGNIDAAMLMLGANLAVETYRAFQDHLERQNQGDYQPFYPSGNRGMGEWLQDPGRG